MASGVCNYETDAGRTNAAGSNVTQVSVARTPVLALPAALTWRLARIVRAAYDPASSDLHLRHGGRGMGAVKAWHAAREQLLGPEGRDHDKLEGIDVDWTNDHWFLTAGHGEEPAGAREAQNS